MHSTTMAKRAAATVLVALIAGAWGSTPHVLAQEASSLQATCTDENGALFRIDNDTEREFDFTLKATGEGGTDGLRLRRPNRPRRRLRLPPRRLDGHPGGERRDGLHQGRQSGCLRVAATVNAGRPVCEGIGLDLETREALFVSGADFRGISSIDITVENGKVLVYDPSALFILEAGGSPAPVFEVMSGTATFDPGVLFQAGYGLLLQGNAERESRFLCDG